MPRRIEWIEVHPPVFPEGTLTNPVGDPGEAPGPDNATWDPYSATMSAAADAIPAAADAGALVLAEQNRQRGMGAPEEADRHLVDDGDDWHAEDDEDDDDNAEGAELAPTVAPAEVITFPLRVAVPYPRIKKCPWRLAKPGAPPIRPFGTGGGHDDAVQDLAKALAPRLMGVAGGRELAKSEPILAPICAAVGALWAVMKCPTARTKARRPQLRSDVLRAAIAALELGPDERTLEQVVLRNHEEHIPVPIKATHDCALPEWRGWLGVFEADEKGLIVLTTDGRQPEPRVLRSLLNDEPL